MKTIIKARAVIIKDHKVFLLKDLKSWLFVLPWWTQENWEKVEETLYREIKEKLWKKAIIDKIIWFKEYENELWYISLQFLFKLKNIWDFLDIDKAYLEEWQEAGFYDKDYIVNKKELMSEDQEEVFYCTLFNRKYQYFLKK